MTSPASPSASPGPRATSPPVPLPSSSERPKPSSQCYGSLEGECLESEPSILAALEELHRQRAQRIALTSLALLRDLRSRGHAVGCLCRMCPKLRADCCRGGLWKEI